MLRNVDRYEKDLDSLIRKGDALFLAIQAECHPSEFKEAWDEQHGPEAEALRKNIPSFKAGYQNWYTEAKVIVKQLLPDRLSDFIAHYEKPKARKNISFENYKIIDYLQGLNVTRGGWQKEKVVGPEAAVPEFEQQLRIVASVKARFRSSLFDIQQLVRADLFDSELDAAEELAKKKFGRGAGAVAGVMLEKHLAQVCESRKVTIGRKPTISDLNDALKASSVIEIATWRFIQHLGDIRNSCDHNKSTEPKLGDVDDLIAGVRKIIKTVF
jgi:hypothetical protein